MIFTEQGIEFENRLERWMWKGTNWLITRPARAALIGLSICVAVWISGCALIAIAGHDAWWIPTMDFLLAGLNVFVANMSYKRYIYDYYGPGAKK